MLMIDVCAGLGGASQAMRDRGWDVLTVDLDPAFGTDVVADVRTWQYSGPTPDLMWMSPPCDEFAREWMPWSKTGRPPSMELVDACRRLVREIGPRWWVLENVRGAVPYLGRPRAIVGPFYLWGVFPPLGAPRLNMRKKESMSSSWAAERAKIPYALSLSVALAVEGTIALPLFAAAERGQDRGGPGGGG
jgi:hypothetical protein